MSMPKVLTVIALSLFVLVGVVGFFKDSKVDNANYTVTSLESMEISIEEPLENAQDDNISAKSLRELPECDRIDEIFNLGLPKMPIVETVTYSSRVEWKKGAAWVVDYARYYDTSRHMIARSLNKGPDYYTQNVTNGDRFNVFRKDGNFSFHLLTDMSKCKMGFYYYDIDNDDLTLIKTYNIGLGRPDTSKPSGSLTPLGTYSLGDKIAVYKDNSRGYYNGERISMVSVFGTRWLPFGDEISDCTEPSKGFGIHGAPWNLKSNTYYEARNSVGKRESDGCLRLLSEDIEELFAIIVSKPTYIHLVADLDSIDLHQKVKQLN